VVVPHTLIAVIGLQCCKQLTYCVPEYMDVAEKPRLNQCNIYTTLFTHSTGSKKTTTIGLIIIINVTSPN